MCHNIHETMFFNKLQLIIQHTDNEINPPPLAENSVEIRPFTICNCSKIWEKCSICLYVETMAALLCTYFASFAPLLVSVPLLQPGSEPTTSLTLRAYEATKLEPQYRSSTLKMFICNMCNVSYVSPSEIPASIVYNFLFNCTTDLIWHN
jgi:hypothetical protein